MEVLVHVLNTIAKTTLFSADSIYLRKIHPQHVVYKCIKFTTNLKLQSCRRSKF